MFTLHVNSTCEERNRDKHTSSILPLLVFITSIVMGRNRRRESPLSMEIFVQILESWKKQDGKIWLKATVRLSSSCHPLPYRCWEVAKEGNDEQLYPMPFLPIALEHKNASVGLISGLKASSLRVLPRTMHWSFWRKLFLTHRMLYQPIVVCVD